ncbi:MAG: glycosyltransferase family 39 protein [Bacteroidales bacterium]|jgi:hypothetical protein|nr:glycosyltransferase family 39 protein [Bacteroidales bacterium]
MQQNTKQLVILFSTLFGIACFQILLAFQGFDLCDEGFSLTFFQQIFNDPQSVEYNFLYWLSGIVGGVWLKIFPNAGIFSFRILGILMHLLGLVLMIAIFRKRLPDWILALSCVVLTLIFDYGVITFEHNRLVVVLSLAAFYFLIKGIEQNKWWALLFSGYLLAVNVFSRSPNLTLWAWIILIPLFSTDWKKSWKQIGIFCMGLVAGVLDVFLIMWMLGHVEIFANSVRQMFDIAGHAENAHSFKQLTGTFIQNYKSVGKYAVLLIGLGGAMFLLFRFFEKRRWINYAIVAVFFGCFWFWMSGKYYVYWIYALCFLAQALLYWKTNDKNLRRLISGSIMMMIFLPVGSDWGIGNMGLYSIWLAVPLMLWWGFSHIETSPIFNQTKRWFFTMLCTVFCILQIIAIANQAYFDKGSRLDKHYSIQHPVAKYIYTTKFRADMMNHLIPALNRHISSNDYVLAFEHIPMIHAITQSKPYLYSPWSAYGSAMFIKQLSRAEQTRPLPIVVKQHFESFPEWSAPQDDYYAENKPNTYKHHPARTATFNAFLKKYNYEMVWSNGFFSIWIAGETASDE